MTMAPDSRTQPDWRFMLRHPAHVIAMGFGSGLAPKAPGTFGTLLGWWMFSAWPNDWTLQASLACLVFAFVLGVWVCDVTGRHLGVADHGGVVWDEIVAIWVVLLFTPAGLAWQALAVLLFRIFDITKPTPIRELERRCKGGFGVMIDDLLAAVYALVVLMVVKFGLPWIGVVS